MRRRVAALAAGDAVALVVALVLAYQLRFRWELGALERAPAPPLAEYAKLLVLVLLLVPLLLQQQGLYGGVTFRSGADELAVIVRAVTVGAILILAVLFFYRPEGFQYSRLTVVYWWVLSIGGIALVHARSRRRLLARYRRGLDRRRAVVIGDPGSYLVERLRTEPAFGLELAGYLSGAPTVATGSLIGALVPSAHAGKPAGVGLSRLGELTDLPAVLARGGIQEVILADHRLTHAALLDVITACDANGVAVRLVPPVYDFLLEPVDVSVVGYVPLLRIDDGGRGRLGVLGKRLFDVAVSAALLVLLLPLFGLIALAIRLTSPGPVLFVQTRAGKDGVPFRMLKFRTMVADAEHRLGELLDVDRLPEPVFKLADDPRVTRVGRFLRRFSLDEAPQLWNVLRGDMSLVGPRPEELRVVERYDVWQRRRLKAKPGLTGLQQVEARGASTLAARVRLDMQYIRHQGFLLDLLILARTVRAVLAGRGAS